MTRNYMGMRSLSALFYFYISFVSASSLIDVFPNHKIDLSENIVSYSLVIDNCQSLSRVEYYKASGVQTILPSESQFNSNDLNGCKFVVEDDSATKFNPSFTLFYSDNSSESYSESF